MSKPLPSLLHDTALSILFSTTSSRSSLASRTFCLLLHSEAHRPSFSFCLLNSTPLNVRPLDV
ncbi:hypothetical protein DBR36_03485 [Microbacterium sp. HMWF026]|nr:hypothetical protein DBR36_03485 [Microbacterium sp. HMWF026]